MVIEYRRERSFAEKQEITDYMLKAMKIAYFSV